MERRLHGYIGALGVTGFATLLSAFALNGVGAATSEVTRAGGAVLIRTQTFGIAVRTHLDDAGVAIGYTSTLRVFFEADCVTAAGYYPFGIRTGSRPPVVSIDRVVGLAISANRLSVGLMAGLSEEAVLARVSRDASVAWRLSVWPYDPRRTELRICRSPFECP